MSDDLIARLRDHVTEWDSGRDLLGDEVYDFAKDGARFATEAADALEAAQAETAREQMERSDAELCIKALERRLIAERARADRLAAQLKAAEKELRQERGHPEDEPEFDEGGEPRYWECPYYMRGLPGADPQGTCGFGCYDEPACMTCHPSEPYPGWEAALVAAKAERDRLAAGGDQLAEALRAFIALWDFVTEGDGADDLIDRLADFSVLARSTHAAWRALRGDDG